MLKPSLNPALLKKTAKIAAITVASVAVLGFLVLPLILRPVLEKKLSAEIHRTVTIRSISLNPFALSIALKGVSVSQRDSAAVMLSFDEFYVNLEALSLVRRGLIISSVRLIKPYMNVRRNKDLTYNFSDLIPPSAAPAAEEKPQQPFRFSINNIEVKDGSIDFIDVPKDTSHSVRDLNIAIPFISDLPYYLSDYVKPSFRAVVNGTEIVLQGKTLPFNESLETTLDVYWNGVDIPHYLAYSPVPLKIRLQSGTLDVQVTFSFRQYTNRPPSISLKGTVNLNNIRLAATATKRILEFRQLSISFLPSDLMEKHVHLSEVSLRAPKLYAERERGGELVITNAILAQLGVSQEKQKPAPATEEGPAPVIDVDSFSIQKGMVSFIDWEPVPVPVPGEEEEQEPARVVIDNIALKAGPLSTRKDGKGKLDLTMKVNKRGTLRTAGTIGLVPLDIDASVNISNIELAPLQPYLAQQADVEVADGRFSADGTARIRAGEDGSLSATYQGSAAISRLDLRDSKSDDELLSWKRLSVEGIDAVSSPPALRIKNVALTGFAADILVEEDGRLNLVTIVKQGVPTEEKTVPPVTEKAASVPKSAPQLTIGQVVLKDGTVNFTDRHVKPLYTASLLDVEGRVTGLTSKKDLLADVQLRASLDRYAPLAITGKIHPFGSLSADIRADFKDMELSPLTPYSDTYIGNAIEKGKLSFGLEYHIADKKLEAKNDIFIDQLTLGEKVESPKATSLPVGLAISLLKNRKGEIRLDIPVSGEIDDPEFSVGKVILQVLVNLLTKAATSPFALLGSMMGGEDLGYVEFDYGRAALTAEDTKKIDTLVNALYDRPSLKLEITGYADPEKDREALRAIRMHSLIAAEKIKDLPRDERTISPDAVQISAAEYPIYLKKAYRNGKFSKPRNFFGFAKDLPDAEMEKLLLASIVVSDDDLRQLASTRARVVQDGILRSQKIEPQRVFLLEPKSLAPEQKDKLKESRVEFSLK
jgi:uncharacterized protein involved in outer membrane biogenesis